MRRKLIVAIPLLPLAACGGGGAGTSGSISGLEGPSEISVLTADTGSSSSATAGGTVAPGAGVGDFPVGADYFTDEQNEYVYDPSMEALGTINLILGMARQTAYPVMVNQGAYLAQIDQSLIETGGGGNGQGGSTPELQMWTARSTRATNDSPQYAYFWVPGDDPGTPETIFAQMSIYEGASVSNPFGDFGVNFARAADYASIGSAELWGQLLTLDSVGTDIGFSFYESKGDLGVVPSVGDEATLTQAVVQMAEDQAAGSARVSRQDRYDFGGGDTGVITQDYTLAYDDTHVLRQKDAETPVCLSRTEFNQSVWGYTLYNASGPDAGERVEMNGGFNFVTDGGEYGWMSYWGMWLPPGVTVDNGDTVTKVNYGSSGSGTEYTVAQAPGRLIRYTQDTLTLAEITGDLFEWWDFSGTPAYYRVSYNGSGWFKTAVLNDSTGDWDALSPTQALVLSSGEWLGMWSNTLGGSVNYVEGESTISYSSEEIVSGGDSLFDGATSLTLYGFTEMLASEISQVNAEAGSIYMANAPDAGTPYEFTFDQADLTLIHDVNGDGSVETVVGLDTGVEVTSGPFSWGMRSGPMVTDLTGVSNIWDLWSASEYYVYETGHNPWNKFQALVTSGGDYAEFDAPIQFSYLHTTAADRNDDPTFDGKTVLLQYEGAGTLWGIPDEQVDLDGDGNSDHYKPLFAIADGTLMGPTGVEYVAKAVDVELSLAEAPGECGALSLTTASGLTLPDGSTFVTPGNGVKPVVAGPPSVIAGVVQGSN
ncbi:hypothetical protein [Engelhardtia mirabilis]|uniref:Uncharacterized protein n=1 Tax=Engelhardtia mirabilis TaxID=2528011 RepID=A0A518BRG1_9BACT|nr:hypothetical protein Pla133_46820 [Planctomycetes bacterium Pla133]QDV03888.1 hypothetical protein Pla86_46800 [Planctomycetes bacterium Pla86]